MTHPLIENVLAADAEMTAARIARECGNDNDFSVVDAIKAAEHGQRVFRNAALPLARALTIAMEALGKHAASSGRALPCDDCDKALTAINAELSRG